MKAVFISLVLEHTTGFFVFTGALAGAGGGTIGHLIGRKLEARTGRTDLRTPCVVLFVAVFVLLNNHGLRPLLLESLG